MFVTPAYAQAAGSAASGGAALIFSQMAPFALLLFGFYFLILRPQQKRAKEHRARIDAVKKGDTVVTAGGLIAKVTKVDDDEIEAEIAPGVKARIVKATLTDVRPLGGAKPAND